MRPGLVIALLLAAAPLRAEPLAPDDFNVFSLSDIRYAGSDFEGRAGAARDVSFSHFMLGEKARRGGATLIVGGSADLSDGSVRHGGIRAGGSVRRDRVDIHGVVVAYADVSSLACVARRLLAGSDRLSQLPVDAQPYWDRGLVLAARSGAVSTVRLTAEELGQARAVILRVPSGSVLVINVSGAVASLSNTNLRLEGSEKPGVVVFNFPEAVRLTLRGVRVPAVVLAPRAETVFTSGAVDGRLYVGGLSGDGQVNEVSSASLSLLADLPPCD